MAVLPSRGCDVYIQYESAYGEKPENYVGRGTTDDTYSWCNHVIEEGELPVLSEEGKDFLGWTYNGEYVYEGDTLHTDEASPFYFTYVAVWQAKQFKHPYLDKTGLSHFLSGLWQKITAKMTAETDRATAAEEALDAKIVQADWNENDETSMAYIINKPDFVAITTAEIDEICVDFTLYEASAVLTEIDEVIGG